MTATLFKPLIVAGVTAFISLIVASPFLIPMLEEQYSHFQNRDFIRWSFHDHLLPAATWIDNFVQREQRLPTAEEMRGRFGDRSVHIYREPLPWQRSWGSLGRDYLICYGNNEWCIYYSSWDKQRNEVWLD